MKHIKTNVLLFSLILCLSCVLPGTSWSEENSGILILPNDLKRIEDEAFDNISADVIIFPDGIEYIDDTAFSGTAPGIGKGSADNTVAITWCEKHGWTYQAYPRYFALVIGNWIYDNHDYFSDLSGIDSDINAIQHAISDLSQNWNVSVANNLSAEGILSAVSSIFSHATRETDVCLLYYSGHGDNSTTSTAGSLFGTNGKANTDGSAISGHVLPSVLCSTIDNATLGRVIVILDSCGSGAPIYEEQSGVKSGLGKRSSFARAVINAFRGKTLLNSTKTGEMVNKYIVLAACEYGKTSESTYTDQEALNDYLVEFDSEKLLKIGSAFSYSLVKTMGCNYPSGHYSGAMTGDINNDGKLSLLEAYQGIKNKVNEMNEIIIEAYKAFYYDTYGEEAPDDFVYFDQVVQMSGPGEFVLFDRNN